MHSLRSVRPGADAASETTGRTGYESEPDQQARVRPASPRRRKSIHPLLRQAPPPMSGGGLLLRSLCRIRRQRNPDLHSSVVRLLKQAADPGAAIAADAQSDGMRESTGTGRQRLAGKGPILGRKEAKKGVNKSVTRHNIFVIYGIYTRGRQNLRKLRETGSFWTIFG